MFTQQFQCTECGYHTPVADDGKHSFGDELYGDQHSNWDAFCTCHECKTLFHRKVVNGETQNRIAGTVPLSADVDRSLRAAVSSHTRGKQSTFLSSMQCKSENLSLTHRLFNLSGNVAVKS